MWLIVVFSFCILPFMARTLVKNIATFAPWHSCGPLIEHNMCCESNFDPAPSRDGWYWVGPQDCGVGRRSVGSGTCCG